MLLDVAGSSPNGNIIHNRSSLSNEHTHRQINLLRPLFHPLPPTQQKHPPPLVLAIGPLSVCNQLPCKHFSREVDNGVKFPLHAIVIYRIGYQQVSLYFATFVQKLCENYSLYLSNLSDNLCVIHISGILKMFRINIKY